jgi:hypothetical protein
MRFGGYALRTGLVRFSGWGVFRKIAGIESFRAGVVAWMSLLEKADAPKFFC